MLELIMQNNEFLIVCRLTVKAIRKAKVFTGSL